MATADTSLPNPPAAPAVKVPLVTMLLVCVVTVLFAVGGVVGAVLYLSKHGKIGGTTTVVEEAPKKSDVATHPKALEPMLINLADEGGHAYLRIGVVLAEEDDPSAKKEEKPVPGADAAVRDTVFEVLGRETSAMLLAADGKEKLKTELLAAIASRNPELKVKAVYFTDFLVQR